MVKITRLAAASVHSRPCVPNLVKVCPSNQIMDATGMLPAAVRALYHVLVSCWSDATTSNTRATPS